MLNAAARAGCSRPNDTLPALYPLALTKCILKATSMSLHERVGPTWFCDMIAIRGRPRGVAPCISIYSEPIR
jgi:hypothetical protein